MSLAVDFALSYGIGVLALRLFTFVAAAAQLGCAGTLERSFGANGFEYPFHVDLRIRKTQVGVRGDGCRDAPDRQAELNRLLGLVDMAALRVAAHGLCTSADARTILDPFLVADPDDSPLQLGLHIRCFGSGTVNGVDLLSMREDTVNDGDIETAARIDNWLYERIDSNHWMLRNVMIFEEGSANGTSSVQFERLFETWEPSDAAGRGVVSGPAGQEYGFTHPLRLIAQCTDPGSEH